MVFDVVVEYEIYFYTKYDSYLYDKASTLEDAMEVATEREDSEDVRVLKVTCKVERVYDSSDDV